MQETVIAVLEKTAAEHGNAPAMKHKRNGVWETTTWSAYRDQVFRAARGMMALGLPPGGGVAIVGFNRPEWFIADIGAIAAGGLPAGIYTNNTTEQYQYIADHCEAAVAVAENRQYLDKLLAVRDRLPHLKALVLMEGEASEPGVLTWQELLERGEGVADADLRARIEAQKPEDVCTLIYTSGTTGPPKAVMLSQRNLVWTARAMVDAFTMGAEDRVLSYLPLSHIAEQMVSLHGPMGVGACTWFAESMDKLAANLPEVQPTFFLGVPRVWEKIQAGIEAAGAHNSPLKRKIAAWARRKGLEASRAEQTGGPRPAFYGLADKLVFSKVRERLGLTHARMCATSAAPISLATLEFFASLGIPILEVYGMSECTGPATFSYPDRYRLGFAGVGMPGAELKTADNGEILMRGPHVFKGYYKNEDATRETLDPDGWLHSGDIGEIDEQGFLKVTDRVKELIVTSGGKNISPANLEKDLRSIHVVSQAVTIGDGRKFIVALMTLDPTAVAEAAEAAGSPATDSASAAACPIFHAWLTKQVEEVNKTLPRYETIKYFTILPEELSVEGGELTPTMKLKRRVVLKKYAKEIEAMYAQGQQSAAA